jgi:hypothetical protein
MTGGRIVAIVVGVLGVLLGAAAIAATISILVEDRDADDFFISSEQRFERSSFAIASEDVDVLTDAPGWLTDWLVDRERPGFVGDSFYWFPTGCLTFLSAW